LPVKDAIGALNVLSPCNVQIAIAASAGAPHGGGGRENALPAPQAVLAGFRHCLDMNAPGTRVAGFLVYICHES